MEKYETGKCFSCGAEKVLTNGLCVPCDLEVSAREPPEELKDMRLVYSGIQPRTPGQTILKQLLDKTPKEFLRLKREAESSYREGMREEKKEETVEAKADEGTEKVLELIDQWLQEWQHAESGPVA